MFHPDWILNGRYGFIGKDGQVVIPLHYDYAYDFQDGKAVVEKDGRTFCIDKTGREVK